MRLHYPHFLSIPTVDICRVSISPQYKIPHSAALILDDTSHVLHPRLKQRYASVLDGRPDVTQEGLWITLTGNTLVKPKVVVRNWAKRRIWNAIVEGLKVRGFDADGCRILPKQEKEANRLAANRGKSKTLSTSAMCLRGTVGIQIMEKLVETNHGEVRRQAEIVATEIIKRCGGDARQHGQSKPPRPTRSSDRG